MTSRRYIALGLWTAWRWFFTLTVGEVVHRGVGRVDQLLGCEGEVHGVDAEPGLDLPRLVPGRGDEAPRRLLDTDAQHDVGGAVTRPWLAPR